MAPRGGVGLHSGAPASLQRAARPGLPVRGRRRHHTEDAARRVGARRAICQQLKQGVWDAHRGG
eukprot:7912971-Pyramimonas_sp.AAC.1